MVLILSDLGPSSSCCEIRDLPAPSSNNEQDKIGYISRKKYQYHPRTEEDGGDDHELARKKKLKRSNTDTEADASSSESDHSCFVALVKASNLHNDALQRECSKYSEKDLKSTEPSGGNKTRKATNNKEEKRDSSSAIKHQFVTLTLTPEDVRDCKIILPSEFMKANGINKIGKITLLGQKRMKWFGYLLTKYGIVAMGSGWKGFCEANGVKTGESFTLEYIYEQDTTDRVFKFRSLTEDESYAPPLSICLEKQEETNQQLAEVQANQLAENQNEEMAEDHNNQLAEVQEQANQLAGEEQEEEMEQEQDMDVEDGRDHQADELSITSEAVMDPSPAAFYLGEASAGFVSSPVEGVEHLKCGWLSDSEEEETDPEEEKKTEPEEEEKETKEDSDGDDDEMIQLTPEPLCEELQELVRQVQERRKKETRWDK